MRNSASDRSVWCDFSKSTNYYDEAPETGVTVEYWFELTNITAAPDGVSRDVLSVNGSVPGPTIMANWGDTVKVHVVNSLTDNGTSIHFHGIRQNYTNANDGVVSITQCPTAPDESVTYTWRATQYGSSWYHSHYALQAWEGVFGGIVIHGPATANYDEDLGNLFLNDWDHATADASYASAETDGPPTLQTGTRWSTDFTSGTSYLLRLVDGAIDTHFDFSIDNHTLQVIAMDFVPIVPYYTDSVSIGMGQRYDIIVTANMSDVASDFWLRAAPDTYCSDNANPAEIKGIIHYDGGFTQIQYSRPSHPANPHAGSTSTPTTTGYTITENDCFGEPLASLVPFLEQDAGTSASVSNDLATTVAYNSDNLFKWYIGSTSFLVEWEDPTALQILNNAATYSNSSGVIELPTAKEWNYLIIETTLPIPHPVHLHGHDFSVLAAGYGTYAAQSPTFQTSNPPRRDVTMLPAAGYLALAFRADNPGAWLCHCHIGWHTAEGFALQFVERYDEIAALYDRTALQETCEAWSTWQAGDGLVEDDSGV
ncbi:hypothetical protein LTR85_010728 [Meristemomyces frigidus]|nr:hypothetical protein LTR85_010728 [Meristemomyces frigidus]